ncbi:MAG: hypothetical protein P8X63_06650 [Desulfuromonadaceae bacterium]|jgi:hypothetical protein
MAGKDLFFALTLLAAIALVARCWRLEHHLEQAKTKLAELGRQLQTALQQKNQAESRPTTKSRADEFSSDLAQAHLKQRLKGGDGTKNIPEKYRMVSSMARRGLEADVIADILEISPGEADQLLKLVRVPGTTETEKSGD